MRVHKIVIALLLVASTFQTGVANATVIPVVKSFKFSPSDVESMRSETKVIIEIVAYHPGGIENTSVLVQLTNSKNNSLAAQIFRSETPYNYALSEVTFKGELIIPRELESGVYEFSSSSIRNLSSAGYQYETGKITPSKIRSLVGGETGLLVRNNGFLNLAYETFIGPSYDLLKSFDFTDKNTFNSFNTAILRVGEVFDPSKYFENKVPALTLKTSTQSPTICSSSGTTITFLAEGNCAFSVFTEGNNDYVTKSIKQNLAIKSKRIKPQVIVPIIPDQKVIDLGKSIQINLPLSPTGGILSPLGSTPDTCIASAFFIKLVGGGRCTISFQSKESIDFLASDLYEVSFEISRNPQTISFSIPSTANVSSKSLALNATASSGAVITYSTTSTGICSITGSTLNLLTSGNCSVTATLAGTSTLAPVSATANITLTGTVVAAKKTITCIKSKTTKKVTGINPKCPTGYKLKK